MTSIVVVDDHPVFRRGMVALLDASGYAVVGEAASSAEAVSVIARLRPDLVLLDLGLPDGDGISAASLILAENRTVRIVVVTMYDEPSTVAAALAAGVSGYVVKDSEPDEILAALRSALNGTTLLGSGVSVSPSPDVERPSGLGRLTGLPHLTQREQQILDRLVRGLPNSVIALQLGLSGKTIANYVSIVLAKLRVADRQSAARLVRELQANATDRPGIRP